MSALPAAVWAETLKARRSHLPWVTALAFTIAAGFGGLVMFILQDVSRAKALGLLGTKAALTGGEASWAAYFALLGQATAVGGLLIFGLVVVWTFGREFSQDTAKDLLALPTSRATIVGAKFGVAVAWCVLLGLFTCVLGLGIGAALGLPGWSAAVVLTGLWRVLATAVMTALLVTPFAVAASVGRGYLAGVASMFLTVFLAQVITLLGYGAYFPWSVPALFSGAGGPDQTLPGPVGYLLVAAAGITGVTATIGWWIRADQDR
ncbi:ABC transporter permease [Amycolatopsis orientalis]|uniref:ABC transporter permease n=1 Tax=Amycolatopsis orientalis TaxID=31958 RepID=UPI000422C016|nr:ABC transporter permease [Amycolatopsis orientalis]